MNESTFVFLAFGVGFFAGGGGLYQLREFRFKNLVFGFSSFGAALVGAPFAGPGRFSPCARALAKRSSNDCGCRTGKGTSSNGSVDTGGDDIFFAGDGCCDAGVCEEYPERSRTPVGGRPLSTVCGGTGKVVRALGIDGGTRSGVDESMTSSCDQRRLSDTFCFDGDRVLRLGSQLFATGASDHACWRDVENDPSCVLLRGGGCPTYDLSPTIWVNESSPATRPVSKNTLWLGKVSPSRVMNADGDAVGKAETAADISSTV